MPIHIGLSPHQQVTWLALSGRVTGADATSFFDRLDLDQAFTRRWIISIDPGTDLSDFTAASFQAVDAALQPILERPAMPAEAMAFWVCDDPINISFVAACRAYMSGGSRKLHQRHELTLEKACAAMGLAEDEAVSLREALPTAAAPAHPPKPRSTAIP